MSYKTDWVDKTWKVDDGSVDISVDGITGGNLLQFGGEDPGSDKSKNKVTNATTGVLWGDDFFYDGDQGDQVMDVNHNGTRFKIVRAEGPLDENGRPHNNTLKCTRQGRSPSSTCWTATDG